MNKTELIKLITRLFCKRGDVIIDDDDTAILYTMDGAHLRKSFNKKILDPKGYSNKMETT
jgi:hypothetical protein